MQMKSSAILSECQNYRYSLLRQWDNDLPLVNFIGLNPSTADAVKNDPTIHKCIRYAQRWGYGGIIMTNLFAFRTSKPSELMSYTGNKIGKDNDSHLIQARDTSALSIAAWGNDGVHDNRWKDVTKLFDCLYCLKISSTGQPRHPLSHLKDDLEYIEFKFN